MVDSRQPIATLFANMDYRRLIYASLARGEDRKSDQIAILRAARSNNGLNGVSGILWSDSRRYVQVLEGPPDSVSAVFQRIEADDRHEQIRVLADSMEPARIFADWSMASLLPGETNEELRARLGRLLRNAPGEIRAQFETASAG